MEYVVFVDGYFLLGLNQQIFLEIPKDRNELEGCAAAFLERVVQTDSLDGYIQTFQVVRAQLESVASFMGEELTESFFLEFFIAGLEDDTQSYVKWMSPLTVYGAKMWAEYHEDRRLANQYDEAVGRDYSPLVCNHSKAAFKIGDLKIMNEGVTVEFVSAISDNAENPRGAEEEETKMEHTNCSIKVIAEKMEELPSGYDKSHLKLSSPFAQLTSVLARDVNRDWVAIVVLNHIPKLTVELREFRKTCMGDRLDIVDEREEDTHAFCLQVGTLVVCLRSSCELLWDPGGSSKNTNLDCCNYGQIELGHANCSLKVLASIEPIMRTVECRQTKLVQINRLMKVLLVAVVELLKLAGTKLNIFILLTPRIENLSWKWSPWAEIEVGNSVHDVRKRIVSLSGF